MVERRRLVVVGRLPDDKATSVLSSSSSFHARIPGGHHGQSWNCQHHVLVVKFSGLKRKGCTTFNYSPTQVLWLLGVTSLFNLCDH